MTIPRICQLFWATLLTISTAWGVAARVERGSNGPESWRISWPSENTSIYFVEKSINLVNWEAIGVVRFGDGNSLDLDDTTSSSNVFYRVIEIEKDTLAAPLHDGDDADIVAWVSEENSTSLRFNVYARRPSNFVDVHYTVNDGTQLNFRMNERRKHWSYLAEGIQANDTVDFYFTFEKNSAAVDTSGRSYVYAGGTPPTGDDGGDDGDSSGGDDEDDNGGDSGITFSDVLATPYTLTDYSHGIDYSDGQLKLRLLPGVSLDGVIVTYNLNNTGDQAYFMSESGDEWHYSISASSGDVIEYHFISTGPNHIRSKRFTRSIEANQPAKPVPTITSGAGRFRDRHERERRFDPFVADYFDRSTFALWIYDYGDAVDIVTQPEEPVTFFDLKAFDRNTTPIEERPLEFRADYELAVRMIPDVDGKYYYRIENVTPGQLVDIEFTLLRERTGQQYYSAVFRFIAGEGGLTHRNRDVESYSGGTTTVDVLSETEYSFAQAIHNAQPQLLKDFLKGRVSFHMDMLEAGRVGPLYNAASCFDCHVNDGSGRPPLDGSDAQPGLIAKLSDGSTGDTISEPHRSYGNQLQDRAVSPTAAEGNFRVAYMELPGTYADGTAYSLAMPVYTFENLTDGPLDRGDGMAYSPRVPPKLIGLGLLEAIPEETLLAWADPADADGDDISGKVNQVINPETDQVEIGRFGWKAGRVDVRTQTAGALAEDMGVTNPVFPGDGNLEVSETELGLLTLYTQTLAVPIQRNSDDPAVVRGKTLFANLNCVACHIPSVNTGEHPIAELSDQTIRPYSDLLLHDMGTALADGRPEFEADGTEWRTPPLWGIGRTEEVSGHTRYLHDGRARNLSEAILWHGGEAEVAKEAYRNLSETDRSDLIAFLKSL